MKEPPPRAILVWLLCVNAAILIMVAVGGITRLTDSGLSMVEWKPIMGSVPPLNESDWNEAFDKYKAYPQFKKLNQDMTLEEFKGIFFWEYFHRVWGRLIGLVFALPFFYFLLRKQIPRGYILPLFMALVLGGLQGLMGWFMVKSGLVDDPYVSHFRLAAHLFLAFLAFTYVGWIYLSLRFDKTREAGNALIGTIARGLLVLLVVQIVYGAFVAGLRAGYMYNTFPKMLGYWLAPDGREGTLVQLLFHNPVTIQFIHRCLGWLLVFGTLSLWVVSQMKSISKAQARCINIMMGLITLQFILGIVTLLTHVHKHVAVTHQVLACVLMGLYATLVFFSRDNAAETPPINA